MAGGAWSVGTDDLEDVATALRYEENGVKLRRQLSTALRKAVEPAITDAKGRILAMGSAGLPHAGDPLRAAIARRVKAQARLTGKATGVRVRVAKTSDVRGFAQAPRRTNRDSGWRHPVPRRGKDAEGKSPIWVHQVGAPGWFDDAMHAHPDQYVTAVRQVIQDTAERIRNGV